MEHWTCLFTDGHSSLYAVAAVTKLSDDRFNVAVVCAKGSRMEPGAWTLEQAKDIANRWANELLRMETLPSRWLEGDVTP